MRKMLALALALGVFLAGYSFSVGFYSDAPLAGLQPAYAGDDDDDDDELVVDVKLAVSTLDRALSDLSPSTREGAFYVQGDIFTPGGEAAGEDPIGIFHCWGYSLDEGVGGFGIVSQEFELFDRGRIQLQGREAPGLTRAVVGGTGDFKGASGEAQNTPPVVELPLLRFTTTFDC